MCSKKAINMKEPGMTIKCMVQGPSLGMMVVNTAANTKTVSNMDTAPLNNQTAGFMKDPGLMAKKMEKVN